MKLRWKLLIVVVLLVSLGSLYLLEDKFMGNVVWEPITVVDNCSDVDIAALWDEVFVENSSEITIYKVAPGGENNCTQFVAIKGNGVDEIWYMLYDLSNLGFIEVDYVNVTSVLYMDFLALDNFFDLTAFRLTLLTRFDEINNYSMVDASDALIYYNSKFSVGPSSFSYYPEFLTYSSNESSSGVERDYNITYTVFDNKTFAGLFNNVYLGSLTLPTFIEDIADFTFERNSSWNLAFNLVDHFGLEEGVNVGFTHWGINNTDGAWINWSLSANGEVKFKPTIGFIGFRGFILSAMGSTGTTDSNYFTVTIVEEINDVPVFVGTIEDIVLKWTTNVTIYLDQYFEDPEGTTLTYSISGADNVNVVFAGDEMYVWLKSNFTGFERFKVVASDGVNTKSSNQITVFLDNSSADNGGDLLGGVLNDSLLVSPDGISAPGVSTNSSGEDNDEDSKVGFWIMIISGILLVILIIGAIVYFAFFDKGPVQVPIVNITVRDYLKKINSMNNQKKY